MNEILQDSDCPFGMINLNECTIILLDDFAEDFLRTRLSSTGFNQKSCLVPIDKRDDKFDIGFMRNLVREITTRQVLILSRSISFDAIFLSSAALAAGFDTFVAASDVKGADNPKVLRLFFMGAIFMTTGDLVDELDR